jgi:uncharacterized protein
VATPTWIVPLDQGRVGFWTSSAAGKAKRLRDDGRVTLHPCDSRGRVTGDGAPAAGNAALVTSGPDFDAIQAKVKAKYGVMVPVSGFFNVVGHPGKGTHPYGDLGVVITLDS